MQRVVPKVADEKAKFVKPVVRFSDIKQAIANYPGLNLASQFQAFGASFAKFLSSQNSEMTRQLNALLPKQLVDANAELNAEQLLDVAAVLAKAKDDTDRMVAGLMVQALGEERIKVAVWLKKRMSEEKIPKHKAVALFAAVCQTPELYVQHLAKLFMFEGVFYRLSNDTIDQLVKHADRLESIYKYLEGMKVVYANDSKALLKSENIHALFSTAALYVQFHLINKDQATIDLVINQLITAIVVEGNHVEAMAFGVLWLANHGINNESNIKMVSDNPDALGYLRQIGSTVVADAKSIDVEFQQGLFNTAMQKGMAAKRGMFASVSAADSKVAAAASSATAAVVAPTLTRVASK